MWWNDNNDFDSSFVVGNPFYLYLSNSQKGSALLVVVINCNIYASLDCIVFGKNNGLIVISKFVVPINWQETVREKQVLEI